MNIGRWEHHQLASLIASRDISDTEASVLTGYSPYTIANLRLQREFKALVAHYKGTSAPARPDAGERMHTLGMSALEELQQRLADDPDSFSKRELLEMSELLLIKAKSLTERGPNPAGQPVKLAISFVPATPLPEPEPINILDGVSYSRGNDA